MRSISYIKELSDANGLTWDLGPFGSRILGLELQPGGADCYMGHVPQPDVVLVCSAGTPDSVLVDLEAAADAGGQGSIAEVTQGMSVTGTGIAAGTQVIRTQGTRIYTNKTGHTSDTELITFNGPAVSDSNGILLTDGLVKSFTTAELSRFLQTGFRVLTLTGNTVSLRVMVTVR